MTEEEEEEEEEEEQSYRGDAQQDADHDPPEVKGQDAGASRGQRLTGSTEMKAKHNQNQNQNQNQRSIKAQSEIKGRARCSPSSWRP
ncbi:hypothetical protein EYF80_062379 [Liparis tanakae]|uniref:Uncharacterized protein n=1 Tax=Liparis tanakae TaxID=230148 RepID=A0A4Z2EEY4_9TELE|nr:hypothetical protein EYF80_062379 [Liparis tanakae]